MKYILFIFIFIFVGCGEVDTYNKPYVEDNYTEDAFRLQNQKIMCDSLPESMFCCNLPTVGNVQPTSAYAIKIVETLKKNTEYKISDDWHYTETVYEWQQRDCEDEAMTMIHHMVDEGVGKEYLFMVYQLTSSNTAHIFVGIDTFDKGMQHMDVNTKLAPIEERINFHMRMDDAGYDKWIKGNINQ